MEISPQMYVDAAFDYFVEMVNSATGWSGYDRMEAFDSLIARLQELRDDDWENLMYGAEDGA